MFAWLEIQKREKEKREKKRSSPYRSGSGSL